jgi:hypothetical protein
LPAFGIELVLGDVVAFAGTGVFAAALADLFEGSAPAFTVLSGDATVATLVALLSVLALTSFATLEVLLLPEVGFFAFATLHTLLILVFARGTLVL